VEHGSTHDDAVGQAAAAIADLAAGLVDQLGALRGRLQGTSGAELADALSDLRSRVDELLAADATVLDPAALDSLVAIAAAADRIERSRLRIVDELVSDVDDEAALRNWTRSAPGDARVRPRTDD
jgi:hypothetical protein